MKPKVRVQTRRIYLQPMQDDFSVKKILQKLPMKYREPAHRVPIETILKTLRLTPDGQ